MMLTPKLTSRFKKDVEIAKKRRYPMELLRNVMETILREEELDPRYKNHALKGDYLGCFDCHIKPDWVLIYAIEGGIVSFIRTGTHSDLKL